MDASTVQRLLSIVLQEPLFQLGTMVSEEAKILTQIILSQITTRRENREKFEDFSKTLISSLELATMVVPANLKMPFHQKRDSGQLFIASRYTNYLACGAL